MSAVIASRWIHEARYHGVSVDTFQIPLAVFLVSMLVLFLAPFAVFSRSLRRLKARSLLEYGALVGEHGRLVQQRWIYREPVKETKLLEASELGPVADTVSMYEVVAGIRPFPIGKRSLLVIGLPALLPMLAVWTIDYPIKDMVLKLLKTLV